MARLALAAFWAVLLIGCAPSPEQRYADALAVYTAERAELDRLQDIWCRPFVEIDDDYRRAVYESDRPSDEDGKARVEKARAAADARVRKILAPQRERVKKAEEAKLAAERSR